MVDFDVRKTHDFLVHWISVRIKMGVYNEWLRQNDLAGMAEQTHRELAS